MDTLDLFYTFLSLGVLIFIVVGVFIGYKIWRLISLINDLLEEFKLRLNKFNLVREFLIVGGIEMIGRMWKNWIKT